MQDESAMELPCCTWQKAKNSTGANKALDAVVIVRLSKCKVLKVLSQALAFALFIMMLLWLGPNILQLYRRSSGGNDLMRTEFGLDVTDLASLPLLFRDLANEGLIKKGDKVLVVGNTGEESPFDALYSSMISSTNDVKLISRLDSEHQSSIFDEAFDFTFASGFDTDAEFIDRTLKLGGVAAIQLGKNPSLKFSKPWNFKVVYVRRLSSTIIAMRKIAYSEIRSPTQKKLLEFIPEEKKAALRRLEDVLLEPPRAASGKSKTYLKRTKFLPDLLNDSLENYPRRIYIDVGLAEKDGTEWFEKNYPTRNKYFEKYRIETVPDTEMETEESPASEGMSDWLKKNVKAEEFVVMKAEVEVVEEIVKSKAIELVDELFMECKPKGKGNDHRKSRRAYWECLALYGRLRDLGVAVHQWWG